jgi:hypothetical protein
VRGWVGSVGGGEVSLQGKRFAGWRYRVVQQTVRHPDGTTETVYGIHEFYTHPDGESWTSDPVEVAGCSVDDLRVQLDRMLTALELEVIVDD